MRRPDADLRYLAALLPAASPDVVRQLMNVPPIFSISVVTLGHTNDGANSCEPYPIPSIPVALPTRVSGHAERTPPLAQRPTDRSLPPRRGSMLARTIRDRTAPAADALQSP